MPRARARVEIDEYRNFDRVRLSIHSSNDSAKRESLFFADVTKKDGKFVADFPAPADDSIAIAIFLCVLVPHSRGWIENGRTVWTRGETGKKQLHLRDPQKKPRGRAMLSDAPPSWTTGSRPRKMVSLGRDGWFFATSKEEAFLKKYVKENQAWFSGEKTKRALFPEWDRVHMPMYDNNVDGLPGWSFLQNENMDTTETAFRESFCIAARLLKKRAQIENLENLNLQEKTEVLGVGLQLFGSSITYEHDVCFDSDGKEIPSEVFSSTAREDGVGDCEDIAYEIICASKTLQRKYLLWKDPLVRSMAKIAKTFVFGLCLSSVKNNTEAHAIVLAMPRSWVETFNGVENKTYENRGSKCLLLDGVCLRKPIWRDDNRHIVPRQSQERHKITAREDVDSFYCGAISVSVNEADDSPHQYYFSTDPENTYGAPMRAIVDCECDLVPTYGDRELEMQVAEIARRVVNTSNRPPRAASDDEPLLNGTSSDSNDCSYVTHAGIYENSVLARGAICAASSEPIGARRYFCIQE